MNRERSAEKELRKALILLCKIRDELDPEEFSLKEVSEEFSYHTRERPEGSGGVMTRPAILLPLLVDAGYIEVINVKESSYRLTLFGHEYEADKE
jgi:hypothetical protein